MPQFVSNLSDWLRRNIGWSNSRQSWIERLGLLLWLAAAILLYYLSDRLSRAQQVLVIGIGILAIGFLFRRGWLKLFGPVLFYDLVRQTRRPRYFWVRFFYALGLAGVLGWFYLIWYQNLSRQYGDNIPIRDVAEFAEGFFMVFMVIQFIMISLMTPAYVASAIAEEKERKTLEFLLATDLRNREIVFGKLASRVGTLILFLLTGLPILSIIQFFGGIDPDLLIAGFVAALITLLSISSISMFASVLCRKARDAIALTYLIIAAYTILSLLAFTLREFDWATTATAYVFGYTFTTMDTVEAVAAGNTIYAFGQILEGIDRGGNSSNLIATVLKDYAIFHGIVIAVSLVWGVTRMRAIALRQFFGGEGRSASEQREVRRRPAVGNEAMLWKEVFVESGTRLPIIGKLILYLIGLISLATLMIPMWDLFGSITVYILMTVCFFPITLAIRDLLGSWPLGIVSGIASAIGIYFFCLEQDAVFYPDQLWSREAWEEFANSINGWVRTVSTILSSLIMLSIAIRAAGSVSGERDKQTFDSLMTTPLSSGEILWGKWWGCILGMRKIWLWLALVWAIGLMSGGLHIGALPGLIIATFIYAAVFAWLGLWYSVVSTTTLKAIMSTIFSSLLIGGGYYIVFGLCCMLPYAMLDLGRGSDLESLIELVTGFCPPVVLAILPFQDFSTRELTPFSDDTPFPVFIIIGLIGWGFFAGFLANVTQRRFRTQYNRVVHYPERRLEPRRSVYDTFDDDDRPDGGLQSNSHSPRRR